MIYENDEGEYVISTSGCWMPGVYESKRAANYAFRFDEGILLDLQDKANATNKGVITYAALKASPKKEVLP